MKLRKDSADKGAGSGCMARLVRFLDLFLAVIAFGLLVFSFLLVGLAVKKSLLMEKSHVSNHRLNDRSDSTEERENQNPESNLPILRIELGNGGLKLADRRGHLEVIDGKGANYSLGANLVALDANGTEALQIPLQIVLGGVENGSVVESGVKIVVTGDVLSVIHDFSANSHACPPDMTGDATPNQPKP
jgi:hypothetical protein